MDERVHACLPAAQQVWSGKDKKKLVETQVYFGGEREYGSA
ncbi:hypothetical protein [Pontibacter sp. 172403-2]|nr:hypothetical protein [Pontibacter sp. 172403-2]